MPHTLGRSPARGKGRGREARMHEQKLLFDPERAPWVERLWNQAGTAVRRKVVSILAEMARANVKPKAKERSARHES